MTEVYLFLSKIDFDHLTQEEKQKLRSDKFKLIVRNLGIRTYDDPISYFEILKDRADPEIRSYIRQEKCFINLLKFNEIVGTHKVKISPKNFEYLKTSPLGRFLKFSDLNTSVSLQKKYFLKNEELEHINFVILHSSNPKVSNILKAMGRIVNNLGETIGTGWFVTIEGRRKFIFPSGIYGQHIAWVFVKMHDQTTLKIRNTSLNDFEISYLDIDRFPSCVQPLNIEKYEEECEKIHSLGARQNDCFLENCIEFDTKYSVSSEGLVLKKKSETMFNHSCHYSGLGHLIFDSTWSKIIGINICQGTKKSISEKKIFFQGLYSDINAIIDYILKNPVDSLYKKCNYHAPTLVSRSIDSQIERLRKVGNTVRLFEFQGNEQYFFYLI